ncbi:hypothetical protein KFU94_01485 [Chloroflexi bacterium TSY]|nr:hypothetical protein [Chloroflexi bacterium TSY]
MHTAMACPPILIGERLGMMEVNYRIVEEMIPEKEWRVVGVIALWPDDPPATAWNAPTHGQPRDLEQDSPTG